MDLISLLYQQLNFLPHTNNLEQKRLQRAFQMAMDLQEHITVSLHLPEEVQNWWSRARPKRSFAAMLR